jgi:hypothetical protein
MAPVSIADPEVSPEAIPREDRNNAKNLGRSKRTVGFVLVI